MSFKMYSKKINYPYYATWWFFIGILFLVWITPVTSNWQLYFFGEKIKGKLVNTHRGTGQIVRKYAFIYNGYPYLSEYEDGGHSSTWPLLVDMYFSLENPRNNFISEIDFMYFGKSLIFPVVFQMMMVAFFSLVRTKEYRN